MNIVMVMLKGNIKRRQRKETRPEQWQHEREHL